MSSIDSRVVTMKFDNKLFAQGVSSTLSMLDKLKAAVTGLPDTAGKGMSALGSAASKFNMMGMDDQVSRVRASFSALEVVAVTALATIANKAVTAGMDLAKSLTVSPIMEGFREYELKMGSIQTILSNTARYGTTLQEVTKNLDELNHYADKTIYNFGDMTKNIGLFTNAGIRIEDATAMIKGFSNEAAASGTNAQGAASAAYQLSQALSAGTIRLMDWRSLQNVGMGNKNMQNGLVEIAGAMGELEKNGTSSKEVMDNFNGSLEKNWLSADVMSSYLKIMAGEMSVAEQKALGLTDAQIKMFTAQQKMSEDAATKVRTFTQLLGTLRESVGSGWAETFGIVIGDFNQATKLWTSANNVIGGALSKWGEDRNKMLKAWEKMGGREALIDGIANAFKALGNILGPIHEAFRDVFPKTTAKGLYELTVGFRNFTESLMASEGTMENIRKVFHAIFGVLGVGVEVVKGVARYFFSLIGLLAGGTGGLMDFSGSIADIVSRLTDWILKGDYIAKFFDKVIAGRAALLQPIIAKLSELISGFAQLVDLGADAVFAGIAAAASTIGPYLPLIADGLREAGEAVTKYLVAGLEALKPVLANIKEAIADAFSSLSGVGGAASGALGGLSSMFNLGDSPDKVVSGVDKVKGALSSVAPSGDQAKSALSGVLEFLKGLAEFAGKVAGAVAIGIGKLGKIIYEEFAGLAQGGAQYSGMIVDFFQNIFSNLGSALSSISLGDVFLALHTALTAALGGGLARTLWQFGGVMKEFKSGIRDTFRGVGDVLGQTTENMKAMQQDVKAGAILKIAAALAILTASIYVLSTIDAKSLATSMGAMVLMMVAMTKIMGTLASEMEEGDTVAGKLAEGGRMALIAGAMVGFAAAVALLAVAVKIFATMSVGELAKGLTAVAITLGVLVGAVFAMEKWGGEAALVRAAFAVGVLAVSLTLLAGAIKLYASIDASTLADGGAKVAAVIIALGLAMRSLPKKGAVGGAVGMFIMANAMVVLAGALKMIASISGGDSFQAIFTLALALGVLVIAAQAMKGAIGGAVAILVLASALAVLAPILILLGNTDLGTLTKGIVAMGVALLVLGGVGTVVGPGLVVLGAGIALLGVGMMAAGAGMLLFGTGLMHLSASGAGAAEILIRVIHRFLDELPAFIKKFGKAMREAATQIRKSGPEFVRAGSAIISAFLKAVIKNIPLLGKVMRRLLAEGLKTLRQGVPDMIKTGFVILMAFLKGIEKNIGKIVRTAANIVVKFLKAVGDKSPKVIDAGFKMIIKFINGLTKAINNNMDDLREAGKDLAFAIVNGMTGGLLSWGIEKVRSAAAKLADAIPGPVKKILGVGSPSKVMRRLGRWSSIGLALGVKDEGRSVETSAERVGNNAVSAMRLALAKAPTGIGREMEIRPRVTPVLNLNEFRKGAAQMGKLYPKGITPGAMSYMQAAGISAETFRIAEAAMLEAMQPSNITFEQHNHSPKALDPIAVYRNTKNLLSMNKEALTKR